MKSGIWHMPLSKGIFTTLKLAATTSKMMYATFESCMLASPNNLPLSHTVKKYTTKANICWLLLSLTHAYNHIHV